MKRLILLSVCLLSCLCSMSPIPNDNLSTNSSNTEITYTPTQKIDVSKALLVNPKQLVVDDKYIYIIDDFTRALYKFDYEGALITKVERINGQRFSPGGIAIDFDYIYITDNDSDAIIKFAKNLDLEQAFIITINNHETYANNPEGLYIDKNKDIYVADPEINSILKFNFLGAKEWTQGRFGYTNQTLKTPVDVAVDDYGNIYVADAGSQSIKIFDQEWTFQRMINGFSDIHSLFIERGSNKLYVADTGSKKITIYANKETPAKIISNWKEFSITPLDIFVLENKLYVLDLSKNIFVYELK